MAWQDVGVLEAPAKNLAFDFEKSRKSVHNRLKWQ